MSLQTSSDAYEEALRFLYSRIDYERAAVVPYGARDFRLDRMRELLARLGDPQTAMPIVHVAGTKGKGSTSAMIAGVLSAAGYRTGLFSSPHLEQVQERFQIDGAPCQAHEFVQLLGRIQAVAMDMDAVSVGEQPAVRGATFFELTTALALLYFAQQRVDAAVLEVGLGGRLDSTNVCQPRVAVITSISFDHTRQLGNTLAAIAWEKAGIVKPGVTTISGVADEEPRHVLEAVCAERGSKLVQLGSDFEFDYFPPQALQIDGRAPRINFRHRQGSSVAELKDVSLGLLGRHQGANAAVALAAVAQLQSQGFEVQEAAIRRGLSQVVWPARVEIVSRRPAVVLDAAHNAASVQALLATLDESFASCRRLLVFAATIDKDVPGMLQLLLPRFERVILTGYQNNPRGISAAELAEIAAGIPGGMSGQPIVCQDSAQAWDEVHRLVVPNDLVCITGSFFLAAEMRGHIKRQPLPNYLT